MNCPHCHYSWESRKNNPKACPRCKRRLDYPGKREDPLSGAVGIERGFQRTLHVMSILTEELEKWGVIPVIIGGAAVEFYTRDWYATGDIDLALDRKYESKFKEIMEMFDFKKEGRMWIREDLNLYIEIPGDLKDISKDKLSVVETKMGKAYLIGLEDILFDRIQAAEHWKSKSDREQAVRMGTAFYDEIDWEYVREKCEKELSDKTLGDILEEIRDEKDKA